MPVLESTDNLTPRSALRHRPIGDDATKQEPIVSTGATPVVQRASRLRPKQTDGEEEIKEWQRADTGTTRQGRTTAAPRQAGKAAKNLPKMPRQKAAGSKGKFWRGAHPLLYLGIGMLAMLALWTVLSMAVSWGSTTWNDLHYGRPRTFQIDAVVGHTDSAANPSHFIALNLNGRIEVIEFPGGDGSKARIYLGPQLYGTDANLIPVTLSFVDVNGDHRLDMIIHFQNTQIVFINDQGGFRPLQPGERHAVEQFLQRTGQ
jgi:hypothetical protein